MAIEPSLPSSMQDAFFIADKLFKAISKVSNRVNRISIYQLKNLACVLKAYSVTQDMNARYTLPSSELLDVPLPKNMRIRDAFHTALGKGIQGTIQLLERFRYQEEAKSDASKIQAFSEIISASREAVACVTRILMETPDCTDTDYLSDKDNHQVPITQVNSSTTL